eukprot:1452372-Pyramimonas_sp.AAC.1
MAFKPGVVAAWEPLGKLQGLVRVPAIPAYVADDAATAMDYFILSRLLGNRCRPLCPPTHWQGSPFIFRKILDLPG